MEDSFVQLLVHQTNVYISPFLSRIIEANANIAPSHGRLHSWTNEKHFPGKKQKIY